MDKLSEYLSRAGVTQSDFAASVGTSRGYLHDILAGRRKPSLDLAVKIEAATSGAVPAAVWVAKKQESAA